MRRTSLAITKVTVHGRTRYCVTIPRADGPGRERKFFKTKEEAKDHLSGKKDEVTTHGTRALALTDRDRADFLWCIDALKPFNIGLRQAIQTVLPQLAAQERSLTVEKAIERLAESKRKAGLSERHAYTLENRLGKFAKTHGDRALASFTHSEIEKWLLDLTVGPQSANHYAAALHSLFRYGVKHGACVANPCSGIEKRKVVRAAPAILTPDQFAGLLKAAAKDGSVLRAYVALGGLAGLRPAEIVRLDWHDVDFSTGYITVNARHAKTSRRRLIPICDSLRAWLQTIAKKSGPIISFTETDFRKRWETVRTAAELFDKWEGNELRHSYATYRLAQTADAARTALELGNSPAILREHYAELCTAKTAVAFFAILPKDPENLIQLPAA